MRQRLICTFKKACEVLWIVYVEGNSQAQAANSVGLSSGTVSRVVNGIIFPNAYPVQPMH